MHAEIMHLCLFHARIVIKVSNSANYTWHVKANLCEIFLPRKFLAMYGYGISRNESSFIHLFSPSTCMHAGIFKSPQYSAHTPHIYVCYFLSYTFINFI